MGTEVTLLANMRIKPGQADAFRGMVKQLVEATRSEPGTLTYEYFVAEDQESVHIVERYVDSAAAATHLQSFGTNFAKAFFETVEPQGATVYGDPDEVVRAILDGPNTRYLEFVDGFDRR